jgi:cytochrome c-type biogenesis protein CcmH/NrfG
MFTYLWAVLLLGVLVVIGFLFVALQRWTAAKQEQMSAEEFRVWCLDNDLGVTAKAGSAASLNPGEGKSRTRKASARIHQEKPASWHYSIGWKGNALTDTLQILAVILFALAVVHTFSIKVFQRLALKFP